MPKEASFRILPALAVWQDGWTVQGARTRSYTLADWSAIMHWLTA